MKMDIAASVIEDLKKRKGKGGGDKPASKPSKGAALLKAIKAEDAAAIDAILCGDDDPEE